MTRPRPLALGIGALLLLTGLWFGLPRLWREAPSLIGGPRTSGDSVTDLMLDLRIIPLDPRPAKAFTLETLDGKRLAMAELAGRPLLLYFWASW